METTLQISAAQEISAGTAKKTSYLFHLTQKLANFVAVVALVALTAAIVTENDRALLFSTLVGVIAIACSLTGDDARERRQNIQ